MSIPQICPSCGNHVKEAHASDCCYGTPEYSHLGWPSYGLEMSHPSHTHPISMQELSKDGYVRTAAAIKRLYEFLKEEPYEEEIVGIMEPNFAAITLLKKRCEELRKEAAGISLMESRAKRNFAADVLDRIIYELSENPYD